MRQMSLYVVEFELVSDFCLGYEFALRLNSPFRHFGLLEIGLNQTYLNIRTTKDCLPQIEGRR